MPDVAARGDGAQPGQRGMQGLPAAAIARILTASTNPPRYWYAVGRRLPQRSRKQCTSVPEPCRDDDRNAVHDH